MVSVYKNSPKWRKRMEELFAQSDMDKDGLLCIEDFEIWSNRHAKEVKGDPKLLKKSREASLKFWGGAGLVPRVKLTKEQFIDNMAALADVERTLYEQGKESLCSKYIDAVFDVLGGPGNDYLTLDQYAIMLKASNFDMNTCTAKMAFDLIDTDHDGKLSKQDLRDYNLKFWFMPDDPEAAGLYGPKFQ